jgi:hypothetical protein
VVTVLSIQHANNNNNDNNDNNNNKHAEIGPNISGSVGVIAFK